MIPYGRQSVDDDDIAAVTAVLKGDWLTQGPAVDEFEARLCELTGARHAVAFSSGTAALHASCAVAGDGAVKAATNPRNVAATSLAAKGTLMGVLLGEMFFWGEGCGTRSVPATWRLLEFP